ncbi:hypothetical protein BX666DRAFT_1963870 [Dichotomocladium elegans]|nr:hypothetical protein BX666DRAFT_1963870 [Dichotomocladium elegans]
MDIALIINHEDSRPTIKSADSHYPAPNNPGHFWSLPISPKDHGYYIAVGHHPTAVGFTSPGRRAHVRFRPRNRRVSKAPPRSSEIDGLFEEDSSDPILRLVSQMPLKKRSLRVHRDVQHNDKPELDYPSETRLPTGTAVRSRKGIKRALCAATSTVGTASTLRHSKKARTDAAMAYDSMDITLPEIEVFSPDWIPNLAVFDDKPPPSIRWKGTPLDIRRFPYYHALHPSEANIASTLRLIPEQYIRCKRTLILAAHAAQEKHIPFRKSEAQKLCRIDVNKVSALWSIFGKLGWLGACCSGEDCRRIKTLEIASDAVDTTVLA